MENKPIQSLWYTNIVQPFTRMANLDNKLIFSKKSFILRNISQILNSNFPRLNEKSEEKNYTSLKKKKNYWCTLKNESLHPLMIKGHLSLFLIKYIYIYICLHIHVLYLYASARYARIPTSRLIAYIFIILYRFNVPAFPFSVPFISFITFAFLQRRKLHKTREVCDITCGGKILYQFWDLFVFFFSISPLKIFLNMDEKYINWGNFYKFYSN